MTMSTYPGILQVVADITGWDMPDVDRNLVSRLWAEDWNSAEDAAYDRLAAARDEEDEQFDQAMRQRRQDRGNES